MKQIIALLIAVAVAGPAFANQEPTEGPDGKKFKSAEERAAQKLDYLSIVLDLTEDQKAQMNLIQEEHMSSMENIKQDYQPVLDELRGELETIRKESEGAFEEARQKAADMREQYDPKLQPMREALDAEKSAFDELIVKIFDEKQADKFNALKAWKDANKPAHPHNKAGKARHPHGPDGTPGHHNGCQPPKK